MCTQSRQKNNYDGNLTSSGDSSDPESQSRTDEIYTKVSVLISVYLYLHC